jgi:hypothetical protein
MPRALLLSFLTLFLFACKEKKEADSWHSGPKDEFVITTAEQLMEFAKLVNEGHGFGKPIVLGNDIMLNDTTGWENWENNPPANKWVPIGKMGNPFKETFNGNGHVISGIYINGAKDFQGLFGHVSLGAHITRIGVTASYVKGKRNVGIIVGNSDEGTLSNSYSAGIAHGNENVGGLVGKSYYGNVINNYSNSVVHGTEDVGGLVGTKRGGFLINGYFSGSVTGRKRVGSLMGSGKGAINCYYDKETLYSKEFVDNLNIFAGFISMKSWTYKAGLVNAWVYEAGKYPILSDETLAYVDIGNGYGSEEIPYIISTEEQLKNITLLRSAGHLLDKHFKLGEDTVLKNLGNAFVDSLIEKSYEIAKNAVVSDWQDKHEDMWYGKYLSNQDKTYKSISLPFSSYEYIVNVDRDEVYHFYSPSDLLANYLISIVLEGEEYKCYIIPSSNNANLILLIWIPRGDSEFYFLVLLNEDNIIDFKEIGRGGDSGIIEFIIEENLSIKTYPKNDKENLKIFQVEENKIEERESMHAGESKAPYEATWMELSKVEDNYVVYNYPSLWADRKTKSPYIIKVQESQLTWITFSDDVAIYSFDVAEKRGNDAYFFSVGNYFLFEWVDKEKHIAKWSIYHGDDRLLSEYLYIDSLYNTFPIVDYKWKSFKCHDGACD